MASSRPSIEDPTVTTRKLHRENRGPSDSLKDDSTAEIVRFMWAMIPRSPHDFCPFLMIKSENCLKNQNKFHKIL